LRLIRTLNNSLKENRLQDNVLERSFEKWWNDFEAKISNILNTEIPNTIEPKRTQEDMFEEILMQLRRLTITAKGIHPQAVKEIYEVWLKMSSLIPATKHKMPPSILEEIKRLDVPIRWILRRYVNENIPDIDFALEEDDSPF